MHRPKSEEELLEWAKDTNIKISSIFGFNSPIKAYKICKEVKEEMEKEGETCYLTEEVMAKHSQWVRDCLFAGCDGVLENMKDKADRINKLLEDENEAEK